MGRKSRGGANGTSSNPRPEQAAVGEVHRSSADPAYAEPRMTISLCGRGPLQRESSRLSLDPRAGPGSRLPVRRRHRIDENHLQKEVRAAVLDAGLARRASCRKTSASQRRHAPPGSRLRGSRSRGRRRLGYRDAHPRWSTHSTCPVAPASSSHQTDYNAPGIKASLPSSGPGRGQFAERKARGAGIPKGLWQLRPPKRFEFTTARPEGIARSRILLYAR